jgi:hypothetical protein
VEDASLIVQSVSFFGNAVVTFHTHQLNFFLLFSVRIGLWVLSGQGFAGLCGPRYRWEEEENEKALAALSDTGSQDDALPWEWKSAARTRVQETYEFCLLPPGAGTKLSWAGGKGKEVSEHISPGLSLLPEVPSGTHTFEGGVEQILAAAGFGSSPAPARRGVLSEELFETPTPGSEEDGGGAGREQAGPSSSMRNVQLRVIELPSAPHPATTSPMRAEKRKRSRGSPGVAPVAGPSTVKEVYPFTARGAQISSQDKIPFPMSGSGSGSDNRNGGSSSTGRDSNTMEDADVTGLEGDEEEDVDEGEEPFEGSEEPSSGRGSNSLSSLGQPVGARYSIQYSPPTQPRASVASSRLSRSRPSTEESQYPRSESSPVTPGTQSSIPMPPRRARSGPGVPPPTSSSVTMIVPRGGNGPRTRTDTGEPVVYASALGDEDIEDYGDDYVLDQPEPEGSHEADEGEDVVGLLSSPSAGPSPRGSFMNLQARRRHRSGSNSGSDSNSGSPPSPRSRSRAMSCGRTGALSSRARSASISNIVRSRTQSLIRAASRSSSDLAQGASVVLARRSRASSSMARLEEDAPYSSSDASGWMFRRRSVPSSAEANDTFGQPMFGHPLRMQMQRLEEEQAARRRLEDQVARRVDEGSLATPPFMSQSTLMGPATRSDAASTERQRTPEVDAPEATPRSMGPARTDVDATPPPSSTTAAPPETEGTSEESAVP